MSNNNLSSRAIGAMRTAADFVQQRKARSKSAKSRRRHVIVSVAPAQLKAIKKAAGKAGLSREAFVIMLTEEFLSTPTRLIAGGAYCKPDRERMRFYIDESLHHAVAMLAQEIGVPMTVIFTTAIHNRFPV